MRPPAEGGSRPSRPDACLHFHCAEGFATQRLARMLHSLVRVSRRVGCSHSGTNGHGARCDPLPAWTTVPSPDTARSGPGRPPPRQEGSSPEGLHRKCEGHATLLSRPQTARRRAVSSPRARHGATSPGRPCEPRTTAVGRLPAEVQICRRPDATRRRQPARTHDAPTPPEPDGKPLQLHSFPS